MSELYDIDTEGLTEIGIGIHRRKPRLSAWQLHLTRLQLENGTCLAAFDAGIHLIVDWFHPMTRRISLVEINHDRATPGLCT